MQHKKYMLIANWKMYFSFNQAITWLETNKESLTQYCLQQKDISLVLCPSFESLSACKTILSELPIFLGAQDCSEHESGPFTGQVCAQSLQQIGCHYCIIGHSETYENWNLYQETMLKKITILLKYTLVPIICFGESKQEYEQNLTEISIAKQITLFCSTLKKNYTTQALFAYEPRWAIGSGNIPTEKNLENILNLVKKIALEHGIDATMIYGGSVSSETIIPLKKIPLLDGFLLGKASTDFQELKKVVSLLHE